MPIEFCTLYRDFSRSINYKTEFPVCHVSRVHATPPILSPNFQRFLFHLVPPPYTNRTAFHYYYPLYLSPFASWRDNSVKKNSKNYTINFIASAANILGVWMSHENRVMELLTLRHHVCGKVYYNGNNNYPSIFLRHSRPACYSRHILFVNRSRHVYKRNCLINKSISNVAFFVAMRVCVCG